MLETLAQSATFGFGSAFGRDLYRSAKDNPVVLLILGFFMASYGTRMFFTGVDKGPIERFLVNRVIALILVIIGLALICGLMAFFLTSFGLGPWATGIAIFLTVVFTIFIGVVWGQATRDEMVAARDVEEHNLQFLYEEGFSDHEFEEELFVDPDGNTLKLKEQDEERMVFTIVGKRGKRAAIRLDHGRMTAYSGVVKI